MTPSLDDQLDVLRQLARVRMLRSQLAPFADWSTAQKITKIDDTQRRAMFELLSEIDRMVPGCPPDAELFGIRPAE